MSDAAVTLTEYSDYVCPFCYLGRKSLDRYRDRSADAVEVDWHPFDLRRQKRTDNGTIDPDVPDGKDETYYDRVRENVDRLKSKYDVEEMRNLEDVPDVDSLPAQIASYAIQETHPESWPAFHDGVFEALWIDGRDISDEAILTDIATTMDIPADTVESALGDDGLREEVRGRFADAVEAGVTGVPTFLYDGHAVRGAVPPAHFRRLIDPGSVSRSP